MYDYTLSKKIFLNPVSKGNREMAIQIDQNELNEALEAMTAVMGEQYAEMDDEDLELNTLNLCYHTFDETFITFVTIDVAPGTTKEEIVEDAFDEVIDDLIAGEISFEVSDTLNSNGEKLYPDRLKARFQLDGGAVLEVDDIEYDKNLEPSEIFIKYVLPAMKYYVYNAGVITQIE